MKKEKKKNLLHYKAQLEVYKRDFCSHVFANRWIVFESLKLPDECGPTI